MIRFKPLYENHKDLAMYTDALVQYHVARINLEQVEFDGRYTIKRTYQHALRFDLWLIAVSFNWLTYEYET